MNMEMDLNPSSRFKWSQWINIFCISSHIQNSNSAKCSLSREIPLTSAPAVSSRNKMWEEKKVRDKILPFYKRRRKKGKFLQLQFNHIWKFRKWICPFEIWIRNSLPAKMKRGEGWHYCKGKWIIAEGYWIVTLPLQSITTKPLLYNPILPF